MKRLVDVLTDLEGLTTDLVEGEIIRRGVDLAQAVTNSRIAYLHFLNTDQTTIELGVWSSDTIAMCNAVYDRHYPIASAGIWADTARTRSTCVHNDYPARKDKRGLPEGHVELRRHLGVPVVVDNVVRLLVGVGNKATDYDDDDRRLLELVANRIWSVTSQRRRLQSYLDLDLRFSRVQTIAHITAVEYDVDDDLLQFDGMFPLMLGLTPTEDAPGRLDELLRFVAEPDRLAVSAAFRSNSVGQVSVRITCVPPLQPIFPADLKLIFREREIGQGLIGVGFLQNVSDQLRMQDLQHLADTDSLTQLPNRKRLGDFFRMEMAQGESSGGFAMHYIDLDKFKPVNDTYGHSVGDEVLKIVAKRLKQSVRHGDLVARLGGDEFVVLQVGVANAAAAKALAHNLIEKLSDPIVVSSGTVVIGASIGITICPKGECSFEEACARADRALYRAKSADGNGFVLADKDDDV